MALLIGPATTLDFLGTLQDSGSPGAVRTRTIFGLRARQIVGGQGVTMRRAEDGELVLMGGIYPWDGQWAEAWFAVGPGARTHWLQGLAAARELLAQVGRDVGGFDLVAYSKLGSVAGPVLARWFGFSAGDVVESLNGPLNVWTRRF